MNGNQCDNCRTFAPPSPKWHYLVQQTDTDSFAAMVGITRTEPLTFCSPLCVADYAYALAAIEGPAEATEPEPAEQSPAVAEVPPSVPLVVPSGVGWPS